MSAHTGLPMLAVIAESARQTLVLLAKNRMLRLLLLANVALAVLAMVLAGGVTDRVSGRNLFCLLAWWLHGTVLMPWSTIYLGVQAVHGQIEDRTFQYLFLRPVGRGSLLLGKWLAVSGVAAVLAIFGLALLALALSVHGDLWPDGVEWGLAWQFAPVLACGAVAYAAVAAFFGAYFRRPLVTAAVFVVGLQTLTANLDVSAGLRHMTIVDPLRRLVLDRVEPDSRLAALLWPAERDFRPEMIGTPLQELVLLVGVSVLLAVWSYRRTEYDSRDRE